jgi:hypothetical protein
MVLAYGQPWGHPVRRKDLVAAYGRLGIAVAAFVLVAGIVGAPLLPKVWSTTPIVALR